ISSLFLSAVLATALVARADPVPTDPGPGDVFNEGSTCHIAWEVDTTGTWKIMNIELMSGSNTQMNHITTIATVDGTDPAKTTFDYPCPEVAPNSAIYFYQFTSPSNNNVTWTTRFTIADSTGKSDPPANPTEPDGQPIPWGVGALKDPSKATPPPVAGSSNDAAAGNAATNSSSTVSSSSVVSSPASSSSSSVASAPSGLTKVTSTGARPSSTSASQTA
ncbi:hypothetical protein K474DRAFT_1570617, partial [Panus rudis PR-1116 ss-1]